MTSSKERPISSTTSPAEAISKQIEIGILSGGDRNPISIFLKCFQVTSFTELKSFPFASGSRVFLYGKFNKEHRNQQKICDGKNLEAAEKSHKKVIKRAGGKALKQAALNPLLCRHSKLPHINVVLQKDTDFFSATTSGDRSFDQRKKQKRRKLNEHIEPITFYDIWPVVDLRFYPLTLSWNVSNLQTFWEWCLLRSKQGQTSHQLVFVIVAIFSSLKESRTTKDNFSNNFGTVQTT